jgi:geranylgeranyl diphosphate synthase type 3
LKQKTIDKEVKEYAVSYMERMGSFEYSKKCIAELNSKASCMVDDLEQELGVDGKEGVEAIRDLLTRCII